MAVGRRIIIRKNNVVIIAMRAKTVDWSAETIDLTSDDSEGFKTLADIPASEAISISGEGLADEVVLRNTALVPGTSKMLTDIEVETEDGYVLSGDFFLKTYSFTGDTAGEATYSFALDSSGEWAFTNV